MQRRSRVALLVLLPIWTTAAFVACGGDDNGNGGGVDASTDGSGSDAISGGDSGGTDSSAGLVANAADVDVYVTQTANLDASSSTPSGATFSWQLASAPAGSAVTTASIQNATTATPSLVADVIGTYVLTLKVSSGGQSATKNVNVRAFNGKAFFAHQIATDAGTQSDVQYAPTVAGDGGTTTVSCETLYTEVFTSSSGGSTGAFGLNALPAIIDWQEGAPADDAKVAFGFREVAPDGGFTNYLATGTSSSRCDTIKKIDVLTNVGDVPSGVRISPNGDRVAFIRQNGTTVDVATIGVDGTNLRVLGPVFRDSDGGVGATPIYSFEKRRVQWLDETHVAWIAETTDGSNGFSVLTATDGTAPGLTDYMDCVSTAALQTGQPSIAQFAMLRDGTVLVNGVLASLDAGTGGVFAIRPNASTKQCEVVGQIGVQGSNFAVSSDGSRIALSALDEDAGSTDLFIAPLDGGPLAQVRSNDAGIQSGSGYGPQWVQGGSALLFTNNSMVVDGGSAQNAFVVPVQGGSISAVAFSSNATEAFLVPTNDWACSLGPSRSATPVVGVLLSFGLLLLRRRKKQNGSDS